MAGSPHYKELLHTLNEFGVEYLLVGGYAVMKYTETRFTKDLRPVGKPLARKCSSR
jgi:hypothetical protein